MAKKSQNSGPAGPANLSLQQIETAIPKLKKRIQELRDFEFSTIRRFDNPEIDKLTNRIDATLVDIFGSDTLDYQRYRVRSLYYSTGIFIGGGPTPDSEILEKYERGFRDAIASLESALDILNEKLEEPSESAADRALRRFEGLNLHPAIQQAAAKRYEDGHYADAVEAACKALNNLVQTKAGCFDRDGTELMRTVFSVKNPVLLFSPMRDKTDESEQEGMMHLYEGAMLALRNPRAHKLLEDDPETAMEFVAFLSTLAKLLDKTQPK